MGLSKISPQRLQEIHQKAKEAAAAAETEAADKLTAFIEAAPDAPAKTTRKKRAPGKPMAKLQETKATGTWKLRGQKVIVTHAFEKETLMKLDEMAAAFNLRRSELINFLFDRFLLCPSKVLTHDMLQLWKRKKAKKRR